MGMEPLSALGLFLGVMGSLLLLSMRLYPGRWARMFADAGRENGRPKWAWSAIVGCFAAVVTVWYLHFTDGGDLSLAISVLSTFLLARAAQALLSRKVLREGVRTFLHREAPVTFLPYTVVSMALVVLGLL